MMQIKQVISKRKETRERGVFCFTGVLAHKLPAAEGLRGVQPPPLVQVAHDAQPHSDAALSPPVPT